LLPDHSYCLLIKHHRYTFIQNAFHTFLLIQLVSVGVWSWPYPPSSAGVKNVWSHTYHPSHAFMASQRQCYHFKDIYILRCNILVYYYCLYF
jgi:hypothetical protein